MSLIKSTIAFIAYILHLAISIINAAISAVTDTYRKTIYFILNIFIVGLALLVLLSGERPLAEKITFCFASVLCHIVTKVIFKIATWYADNGSFCLNLNERSHECFANLLNSLILKHASSQHVTWIRIINFPLGISWILGKVLQAITLLIKPIAAALCAVSVYLANILLGKLFTLENIVPVFITTILHKQESAEIFKKVLGDTYASNQTIFVIVNIIVLIILFSIMFGAAIAIWDLCTKFKSALADAIDLKTDEDQLDMLLKTYSRIKLKTVEEVVVENEKIES